MLLSYIEISLMIQLRRLEQSELIQGECGLK